MFQKIHITKGSGKLGKSDTCDSAINSINVNTLTNEYCIKQSKNKNSICSVCYSINSLTSFRKNMVNPLQRNSELLSNSIIEFSLLPTILELYFRFDSHGELINLNHLQNYTNIALKNPHCNFTLWTKRFDIIALLAEVDGRGSLWPVASAGREKRGGACPLPPTPEGPFAQVSSNSTFCYVEDHFRDPCPPPLPLPRSRTSDNT